MIDERIRTIRVLVAGVLALSAVILAMLITDHPPGRVRAEEQQAASSGLIDMDKPVNINLVPVPVGVVLHVEVSTDEGATWSVADVDTIPPYTQRSRTYPVIPNGVMRVTAGAVE